MSLANSETELTILKILESEDDAAKRLHCPKCNNHSIINKSKSQDVPRLAGFLVFMGGALIVILAINAIIMLRHKLRFDRLPREVKEKVDKKDRPGSNFSIMGLNIPTKTKIACEECGYVYYENYESGDLIVVIAFFLLVVLIVGLVLYFNLRR